MSTELNAITYSPRTAAAVWDVVPHSSGADREEIPVVDAGVCDAIERDNISMLDTIRNLEAENGWLHTRVEELEGIMQEIADFAEDFHPCNLARKALRK